MGTADAGKFALGAGAGSSYFAEKTLFYIPSQESYDYDYLGLRLETESGFYAERSNFDALVSYGATFFDLDSITWLVDQQTSLLAEYRLLPFGEKGRNYFTVGLGPSLRFGSLISGDSVFYAAPQFYVDGELALLFLSKEHFFLRGQVTYSVSPFNPLRSIFLNLTVRACYRI